MPKVITCPNCHLIISVPDDPPASPTGKPAEESNQKIMAEIQIKLAEIGEVQAEHDDLDDWAKQCNSSDWDGSLREYRDRIRELKQEVQELKNRL